MTVIIEQLVEWRLAGETEVLGENLPQRHFVHHKSLMTWHRARTRAAAVGSQLRVLADRIDILTSIDILIRWRNPSLQVEDMWTAFWVAKSAEELQIV
jgi:hypothetical protein